MSKKRYRVIAGLTALFLGAGIFLDSCGNGEKAESGSQTSMEEIVTSGGSLALFGAGWNLGNTLDNIDNQYVTDAQAKAKGYDSAAEYYETLWGNPVTTKEMIHAVKEAGFQTVRVPVTYTDHIDENGEIREEWLERVKEIVDYVLDEDMYCVINVHHDTGNNGKITADPAALEENQKRVRDRWTQIATYFQDYGQKLVFEGLNELLDQNNNWECQGEEYAETANQLNQTFVDTVRSCRGNNPDRYLIVNTYAAGTTDRILEGFRLPEDTAENRLLAEVHSYADIQNLSQVFDNLNRYLVDQGIPVVLGEFGMTFDGESDKEQLAYAQEIVTLARENEIAYFYWDDNAKFQILDRDTCQWNHKEIVQTLTGEEL